MEEIIFKQKNDLVENSFVSTITFISDLHFDFTDGKYCSEQSDKKKEDFLLFIKKYYANSIICIIGDCYNNYKSTLAFIKELEKEHINGFFVLGNHDYWNGGRKSYSEIIHLFETTTKNFKHFKFLTNGRKYYSNGICFIGDTGWTSFRRKSTDVNLDIFYDLPDAGAVKDSCPEQILSMHDSWVNFANETLLAEDKVIILTHFPMTDFTRNEKDCWWSSETKLMKRKNCWIIFGHTHKGNQKRGNHVSSQRDYNNLDNNALEKLDLKQYSIDSFGILIKENLTSKSTVLNIEPLIGFYSPIKVQNINTELKVIDQIKRRGFIRSSHNKEIFAQLATNPQEYLQIVEEIISGYEKDTYMGYKYLKGLSVKTINAVNVSIDILKNILNENNYANPKIFIMSAIVTGYVYNDCIYLIDDMRPIDDYDVLRFYLMFQTIKHFNLGLNNIKTVRRHDKRHIFYYNVDIWLPVIDGYCLTEDEAYSYLHHTPLLSTANYFEQKPSDSIFLSNQLIKNIL